MAISYDQFSHMKHRELKNEENNAATRVKIDPAVFLELNVE